MDSMNRILSFILGIVVLAIILAIVSSRLKSGTSSLFSFNDSKVSSKPNITITVSPKPAQKKGFFSFFQGSKSSPTPTQPSAHTNPMFTNTNKNISGQTVKSIPKTGPELLFPIVTASFFTGLYFKKRS